MKRNFIPAIILFIAFLLGGLTMLEGSRDYFHHPETFFFSKVLKFSISFLCSLIVWLMASNGFDPKDEKKLQIAFIFVFLGDFIFFLGFDMPAIGIFVLGQILLTYRNAKNLIPYLKLKSSEGKTLQPFIPLIIVLFINVLQLCFAFYPFMKDNLAMFYFIIGYSLFLCISFWVGWLARFTNFFPQKNAKLITIAMILFFFCDVSVGLGIAIPTGELAQIIASTLTFVFYTPALLLLGISGYKLDEKH